MLWGQRLVKPASLLVIITNANTYQLELGTSQGEVLYAMEDGKNADVLTFVQYSYTAFLALISWTISSLSVNGLEHTKSQAFTD